MTDFDNEFAVTEVPTETPTVESTETPEATTETAQEQPETVETPVGEVKFRREIDLGDGSGKQVFEADTAEGLIDKLAEAQTHASRKIREQQAQLKRKPERRTETTTTEQTQQEEITDEDRQFLQQIRWEREVNAIDTAFLNDNPDFHRTPKNAEAMVNFLKSEDLPYTKNNLEYAYQELTESGLLEVASKAAENGEQSTRIESKQTTSSKPASTGIRNTQTRNNRVEASESVQEESDVKKILAEPDLDKARAQMLALMRRRSK